MLNGPVSGEQANPGENAQTDSDAQAETWRAKFYTVPTPEPESRQKHPPMIALKNGWAYSVSKYWVDGKSFHFITTQGDHKKVPSNQVDRVYPGDKPETTSSARKTPSSDLR